MLEQLKSGFKRIINWNKCHPKVSTKRPSQHLDFLINPSFQGVNRRVVLPFQNEALKTSYKQCYLLTREIKSYNVIFNGQNFFDQTVRNDSITCDNIRSFN